uniref:Uncharacterized protein n=1 Tax=Triticum urartu TaxID=4572 RepID=A0A8R7NWK7_TRIUA
MHRPPQERVGDERGGDLALSGGEGGRGGRARPARRPARLEKECGLYERDLKRAMESCDELAWERDDLRKRLRDAPDLTEQVQAPQRDKKILKTNLKKAKEVTCYLTLVLATPMFCTCNLSPSQ